MRLLPIRIVLFALSLMAYKSHSQELIIYGTYPQSYPFVLLNHALSYFPKQQLTLKQIQQHVPKQRAFTFMAKQQGVDVIFAGSTREREQQALPIRIPILKGLNGWRIPLVNKANATLFHDTNTIEKFRALIPGQFHTWSDTKVLESNNIDVAKGSNYEGLFQMLDKGRIDYFPRSVLEVFSEYEARKTLNITIENSSLLHYPTAYYFYVSQDNRSLAKVIEQGLEMAIADGSFDDIFQRFHENTIKHIQNMNRKVFSLTNPYLPAETPLARKELWINLSPNAQIIQ